jgi:two-component system, LytTR family, sensor kinase
MQKTAPVLVHIAGWVVFFTLILSFIGRSGDISIVAFSSPFIVFFLVFLILFYGNVFLLENFYNRRNMFWYILILALSFFIVYLLAPFDHLIQQSIRQGHVPHPPPGRPPGPPPHERPPGPPVDIVSLILFVTTWSLSTVSTIMKHYRLSREKAERASAEKTKAELSFLKAQVNPHFLFNTLNNIYTLTLSKDDKAPEAVRKLSDIMRYVTDDSRNDFVPLENEIICAQDYIDLQRLRLNDKTRVSFKIEGEIHEKLVAPLIFMTFIENAFKYGISAHETSAIEINIRALEEEIHFFCKNRIFLKKLDVPAVGMGIANARRRLEHVYPRRHKLIIDQEEGIYIADLRLFNF